MYMYICTDKSASSVAIEQLRTAVLTDGVKVGTMSQCTVLLIQSDIVLITHKCNVVIRKPKLNAKQCKHVRCA